MATKKGRDFYAELGIERTANQGQIKQAYRKMAMKYHPDKNPGDEASAEKFKNLSTAYAVLSDPNKKRQYDIHGEEGSISDMDTIKVEELGTFGRLFGALITKAGIPIPTEIAPKVISAAQHIASGVERVVGFEVPVVQQLTWGQVVGAKVERQTAHFYRIKVSERDLRSGVIISCSSTSTDKFKLIFFDQEGNVSSVEESQKKKKSGSQANLMFVPYTRYNLSVPISLSTLKHMDDEVPPVFMLLDTYDKEVRSLLPGDHLLCVYGDNWFQSVHYTLTCIQAIEKESEVVGKIRACETSLATKKIHLEALQPEFMEIKKKYEEACSKLKTEAGEAESLLTEREQLYAEYIRESSVKYEAMQIKSQSRKSTSSSVPGLFGKLLK